MGWDPDQYEKYEALRWRPARDLMAALPELAPAAIVDLGCGTGRLARLLAARYPDAEVTGVDRSPAMLARAKAAGGRVRWVEADAAAWQPPAPLDLLVSNAALHWVPDHARRFPDLAGGLAPGGVLAVQMPGNEDAPSHTLLRQLCDDPAWRERLGDLHATRRVAAPADYYRWLAPAAASVDIWTTTYLQPLVGPQPVLEWLMGTTLVPVLDRLANAERERFLAAFRDRLAAAYPPEPDGATLFPFQRFFIVARRA